ncbi:hypothetical protein ACLK1S_05360 [Escherichia coli]
MSTAPPLAAFFLTRRNVNFDAPRIVGYAREAIALREALEAQRLAGARQRARRHNPWLTCNW